jgi:subtilisin family serine protease
MTRLITVAGAALGALLSLATVVAAAQVRPPGLVVPAISGGVRGHDGSSLLVRFNTAASPSDRALARAQVNGTLVRNYHLVQGLEHLQLHGGLSVERAAENLRRLPFVAYAHPNYVIAAVQLPDDEYFAEQWALHNTGQDSLFGAFAGGTADADVDWPEAWTARIGSGAVVAVLDTGIDYRHTDLQANVWQNAAEAGGSAGIDDDGNGYVDDLRGWDFANNDNGPLDGHGHGTHVAGTIGAVANNTRGVAGVMWNGKVMALKILDDNGYGLLSDAVDALQYAVAQGARVSNNSWGYSEVLPEEEADHNALRDAIAAAGSQGHLFVAAAGNDGINTDFAPHFPSSFNLDNIIAVTATDNNDQLAWFASFGPATVDLAAPGDYVFSTYKLFGGSLDDYAWLSGTSMSTPHVAGVAGLLFGLQPGWTYQQVRQRILATARSVAALAGTSVTAGVLDVRAALDGVPSAGGGGPGPTIPPPTPGGLTARDQQNGSALISWTDVTGETGYQLEREKRNKRGTYGGTVSLQASASATSLVDQPGAGDFRYHIRSYNSAGYSSWGVWVEVKITSGTQPCRGKGCN